MYSTIEKKKSFSLERQKNLEETFTKYVDADFEENECKQKTQYYQREFTDNPKERQLQLIGEFKNESGKLPTCNSEIELETL